MTEAIVVVCTMPSEDQAQEMARTLLQERLCACVNILPGVRSLYSWQGNLNEDSEVICLLKTERDRFEALKSRILELHPYELPEVIALPVVLAHKPYLDWIRKTTG